MARPRKTARKVGVAAANGDPRSAIIDAALRLAAAKGWRRLTLAEIAAEAGVGLSTFRGFFASKGQILAGFMRRTDEAMLKAIEAEPIEGEALDRLFETLMLRFEILAPHKAALQAIAREPGDNPLETVALVQQALKSMQWVLAAAHVEEPGPMGLIKLKGLAFAYARSFRVWLEDDDPGLARTMATLDGTLREGAAWLKRLETPLALATALAGFGRALWREWGRRPAAGRPGASPTP
jgi:AcrR family transcriptional regulator